LYRALAGTGAILTPTLVVTGGHIFEEAENEPLSEAVRKNYVARFQTLEYRPVRGAPSKVLDICCLEFPIIVCAISLPMARTTTLAGAPLLTTGFNSDHAGPRRHVIRNLATNLGEKSADGIWLQFTHMDGGVPLHVSGSPICVPQENRFLMVGIMYFGREKAAKSRLIAVDRIASFFVAEAFQVPITTFNAPVPSRPASDGGATTIANNANVYISPNSPVTQTITHGGK
jgi:hypothetical protein